MDIVQNRALLLNTKKAAQIKALIPKSEIIEHGPAGAGRILVNWDQHEAQVLRNMGIKNVPSPILGRYKWPGMYNPFEHQKATADFLTVHLKCFVLNEAGTGKTTAAAWAADYLMTKGLVRRVLVVCPLSIMRTAWQADMFKTIMHRKSGVAYGTREVRAKVIGDTTNEFVIINFDGIKTNLHDILAADFDLVIVDEASAFQTTNTERYKCLEKINKPKTRLWMMTGTPAAQSPVGAYGLAKLVNPDAVPRFFGAFRDLVMRKVTTFKYVPRHDAQQTVFRVLQPAIRFTKEECLDLPDITYTSREVEMTPMQWKYYKLIKNDMAATIQTASVTAVNAAALMNKLLQISAGCVYTTEQDTVEFDISSRYRELTAAIDQTDKKVLVFVPFRNAIRMLREKLLQDGYTVEVVDGSVNPNHRTDIFNAFQNEAAPKVLLLQPAATAHGITLHAADTIVWWGPVTSTEIYLQANARAHRAGLKHPVTVIHLVGSPVEVKLYNMLQNRLETHNALVDMYKEELTT